jgi:histidine triad (HIT) family protein
MKSITKKIIIVSISIVVLVVVFAWWHLATELNRNVPCAFCNPDVIKTGMFYEDDLVRGLCTYKPLQPWHCLVVVKRHVERFEEITDEECLAIGRLLKKINKVVQKINGPSSYLILQKNGCEVGQTVPHVHVHYVPKKVSDNKLAPFGLLWNFVWENFQRPLSKEKLAEYVGIMRVGIENQNLA